MPAGAGERAERRRARCQRAAFDIVERIAQRHHRFGVACTVQIAGEEQRIAVELAVDHVEQVEECSGDGRVVRRLLVRGDRP